MQTAGRRSHGTTRKQPLELFELERLSLQPIPERTPVERTPEVCSWAQLKVHRDTHVQFADCLYSVPYQLIGTKIIRNDDDSACVQAAGEDL
jgi:hypothetical protein